MMKYKEAKKLFKQHWANL